MIKITKELKIEVSKPNIFQAIVAKQYDMNTRFLKVTLVDGDNVIDIPKRTDGSIKVVINAERPDGTKDGFEGEVNGDDDTVTVPLHSWMLEIEGTVICDISLIDTKADDNKKLTTTSFTLLVEKAAYGGDDITSEPQYDVMVSMLESCHNAKLVADDALEKSSQALEQSNEANSKYDACVEATNNANAVRAEIEEGGYIESLKELNSGGKFSFWVGTEAEYSAIEEPINNCFYITSDDKTPEKITQLDARVSELENNEKVLFEAFVTHKYYNGNPVGYIDSYFDTSTANINIPDLLDYKFVKVVMLNGDETQSIMCSIDASADEDGYEFVTVSGVGCASFYNYESMAGVSLNCANLAFQKDEWGIQLMNFSVGMIIFDAYTGTSRVADNSILKIIGMK